METDLQQPGDQGRVGRRLLGAGLLGAGGALLATQRAAATAGTPPERPTAADVELLAFAQSVELAARDLYEAAIAAGAGGDDRLLPTIAQNHEAYAQVISGLIGAAATQRPNAGLLDSLEATFASSDSGAVLAAAYDLESAAIATHTELLGQLEGTDGAAMIASILIIEARHCAVIADARGLGDDLDALLDNEAEGLSPDDFPLEP